MNQRKTKINVSSTKASYLVKKSLVNISNRKVHVLSKTVTKTHIKKLDQTQYS